MNWHEIERQESADGRAVAIMESDGEGHYRYRVTGWMPAAPEDEGALGDGCWTIEEVSGLYGWKTPCRNDAARALRLRGLGPQAVSGSGGQAQTPAPGRGKS